METKEAGGSKKPSVALKDLKTPKNPKGGAPILTSRSNFLQFASGGGSLQQVLNMNKNTNGVPGGLRG
jgi:hypothetical protein